MYIFFQFFAKIVVSSTNCTIFDTVFFVVYFNFKSSKVVAISNYCGDFIDCDAEYFESRKWAILPYSSLNFKLLWYPPIIIILSSKKKLLDDLELFVRRYSNIIFLIPNPRWSFRQCFTKICPMFSGKSLE